jgi:hypothetical protein
MALQTSATFRGKPWTGRCCAAVLTHGHSTPTAPDHEGTCFSGRILHFFLYLGARRRWVGSFSALPVYIQRVSRPQCWSGRFGEETYPVVLSRIEKLLLSCPSRSLVTMLNKLRMSYRGRGTRFAELRCKNCKYFESRGAAPRGEPTSRLHDISTVTPCCKVNVIVLFAGHCSTRLDLRKGQNSWKCCATQHNCL